MSNNAGNEAHEHKQWRSLLLISTRTVARILKCTGAELCRAVFSAREDIGRPTVYECTDTQLRFHRRQSNGRDVGEPGNGPLLIVATIRCAAIEDDCMPEAVLA